MLNKTRLLLTVVSIICLSLSIFAQQLAPGGSSSPDEVALRALVAKYFEAYAKKDLDAIAALWGNEAPGVRSRHDAMRRMFTVEDYKFSEPAISRVRIEGGQASARVVVDRDAIVVRGSSTSVRKNTARSDFSFVKENGEWKFWSEAPAITGLATALAAAKTDADREALLAADQELVSRELLILLTSQSDRAYEQRDYARSLSILMSQRLVAEKLGDKKEASHAFMNTGIIHFTQKRPQQALGAYQKGLAIEEELGRKSETAGFLSSIGLVQSALGKPREAIESFQRGLAIHEELNQKVPAAKALENIGDVHYEQGDYALASDFYKRSLKWLESKTDYAGRLFKIAKTEYELGNDDAAIGFYSEAASRLEAAGDKRGIGYAMHSIANIYYSQGDYAQAMNYYRRCLAAEKEAGTRQGEAGALLGIGLVHSLDGNFDLALEAYRENLSIAESIGDVGNLAIAWQKVGSAHFSSNQLDQALEAYKKTLTLLEPASDPNGIQEKAGALVDVGVVYAAKADFTNALDAYQKAKALFESVNNPFGVATVLLNESMVSYAQGDFAKTIDLADKAAAIAKGQDGEIFWAARYRSGKAQYRLEKLDLARQAFTEAVTTIETLRPEQKRGYEPRFYESKLSPYQAMVDVAITEGKGNEAFDYVERAKARVLKGVLQSGRVWINKTMTPREREQERKFLTDIGLLYTQLQREQNQQKPNKARMEDLTGKLQKTQKDYATFRDKLFALRPQLKMMRGEGKPLDAARAAALLTGAETALLDLVETEESVYLFAFTKTGGPAKSRKPVSPLKIYMLGTDRADLYARVTKFQEAIAGRSPDAQTHARELYDLLLEPVREQLAGKKHLIISPDAVSWNLPFQALRSGDDRYLIEDYAVSYAPSLTALEAISRLRARPRPRTAVPPSLLAIVNPSLSPVMELRLKSIIPAPPAEQPNPAPDAQKDAQKESDELSKLYGEKRVAVLEGTGASEDRMKAEAGKYDLLHLDVRGALNETAPLFSFSTLSSTAESKEDGALEVREIFDLNLKSDLAVMPGSELILPKAGAIRSATGLTWAWFVAGCPATVVSRWRGGESSDLMLEFHRRLKTSWRKESKARSWQAAVQQLLSSEDRRDPYFWAGFLMLGDAR